MDPVELLLAIPVGALIGLSLGALGGGGSILTVPALVYVLGQSAHGSTTASLVIVGLTSLAGAGVHMRAGRVRLGAGLVFGVVGTGGSYLGSRLSASLAPEILLAAFSVLIALAGVTMLRRGSSPRSEGRPAAVGSFLGGWTGGALARRGIASLVPNWAWARHGAHLAPVGAPLVTPAQAHGGTRTGRADEGYRDLGVPAVVGGAGVGAATRISPVRVLAAATVVGLLTGFFGVGGGFVVVPALVLALGFDMPTAVGTSLLVIAINSATALVSRLSAPMSVHVSLLAVFTAAAVAGTFAGGYVASRARPDKLVRAFSFLLMAVAVYVAARSFPHLV
jgi:hypothetical protein